MTQIDDGLSRCDNCGGEFDSLTTGTTYLPDPLVVMEVPVGKAGPDMNETNPERFEMVATEKQLDFCTEGCSDAWFEQAAAALMMMREAGLMR